MYQLQAFASRHLTGLLALWSRRWGQTFPLDAALWKQNTEGDPHHFDAARCWVIENAGMVRGALALKVPDDPPAWPGQDPRRAWISFLVGEPGHDREIGALLTDRALTWLREAGFERVSYGGDPWHFFPGAPVEDLELNQTLAAAGFQPGDVVHDLLGDLRRHAPHDSAPLLRAAEATVRECERGDVPTLLEFVAHEFPGRWEYETRERLRSEPTPVDILLLTHGDDVIGFCHVYHPGSRRIGPSMYWRDAVDGRCGGLGPLGIGEVFRGRGLGRALVGAAVEHLRRRGVERAVVDWTTLLDFYGRLGFAIWRTYRPWRREL